MSAAIALFAGCTAMPGSGNTTLASLHLFDTTHAPRFALYVTCTGQVTAETELCWVPFKYFAMWADARRLPQRQLAAFDPMIGVAADARIASTSSLDYRIVVTFRPIAMASYSSEVDGMGGYISPKAGYDADVFVYSASSDKLLLRTEFHRKSEAKFKADSIPYIKDGVRAVVSALDPDYTE